MKTHFFKRGIAGLLSLVMCLSALIELGTTTAFAAGEQAEVYLISFPRSGDANLDYSGTWGHSNLHYMNGWYSGESKYTTIRAMHSYDGNICYCIEPGTPQDTGDRYTSKDETFWDNLPSDFNTFIFIDEIYLLFQHEYSANFLFTLWKRVRKYGAYATGITQNVDDLLQSHTARTMLANSEFIVMLNQASTDRLELAKLLNISDTQLSYITNVDAGHGLIKVGSSLVPFANKFPKNTKLYKLMTTKPGEGA